MADKPENKGGKGSQSKTGSRTGKAEFRDTGVRRPLTEQKVTSNLKPPTRPRYK